MTFAPAGEGRFEPTAVILFPVTTTTAFAIGAAPVPSISRAARMTVTSSAARRGAAMARVRAAKDVAHAAHCIAAGLQMIDLALRVAPRSRITSLSVLFPFSHEPLLSNAEWRERAERLQVALLHAELTQVMGEVLVRKRRPVFA